MVRLRVCVVRLRDSMVRLHGEIPWSDCVVRLRVCVVRLHGEIPWSDSVVRLCVCVVSLRDSTVRFRDSVA